MGLRETAEYPELTGWASRLETPAVPCLDIQMGSGFGADATGTKRTGESLLCFVIQSIGPSPAEDSTVHGADEYKQDLPYLNPIQ